MNYYCTCVSIISYSSRYGLILRNKINGNKTIKKRVCLTVSGIHKDSLALHCFVCDSSEDKTCASIKTGDTNSMFYKPCRVFGSASKACVKFTG